MSKRWTKEEALQELLSLSEQTKNLANRKCFSEEHIYWIDKTLTVLEEVFGRNSRYYVTFKSFQWSVTGQILVGGPADPEGSRNPQKVIEKKDQEVYLQQLEIARGLLIASHDYLKGRDINSVYEGKNTGPESSDIIKIINLTEKQLRKTIRNIPTKEKEIQDAFENLLIAVDIQYLREKESIPYSSKTYTPDFTIPKIELIIEIKLCNRSGREKEIIAEINDDIIAYQTKYGNLLFIIYDLGSIRDIELFTKSVEQNQNVIVKIIKH